MKEVFLGGTCNGSKWREILIPLLKINYFNPVVPDWNEAAAKLELEKRQTCDYCLYVITPAMTGFYSIAEVVDDSNKRPEKTVLCVLEEDNTVTFTAHQMKSLKATSKLVQANGGEVFTNLIDVSNYLNYNEIKFSTFC